MDTRAYTQPDTLEKYGFWWSEVRLVVAAVALLLGGVPPIWYIIPPVAGLFGVVRLGLTIAWIISGLAAGYLLYRWYEAGMRVFGGTDTKDKLLFLVLGVSGINLGLAGISGRNIGMSILSNKLVFIVVAALYLYAAYHLYGRYKASGRHLFAAAPAS